MRLNKLSTIIFILLIIIGLTACLGPAATPNLVRFPTAIPTQLDSVGDIAASPTPTVGLNVTPTFPPDAPALVLPDESGIFVACETNTLQVTPLTPDGTPFLTLTRVEADRDQLYLIGDGGLYRISQDAVLSDAPQTEALLPAGETIAGRLVQELVDVEVVKDRRLVYALDKAGHVYRYEIPTGQISMAYRNTEDDDKPLDVELVAVTADERGEPVMLDTAEGALQAPGDSLRTVEAVNESRGLTSGVDVARSGDDYYILTHNAVIRSVTSSLGSEVWLDVQGPRAALSLKTSDHLGGSDILILVDGVRRQVIGLTLSRADLFRTALDFDGMGLLRDAVFAGERMYAIADQHLYVYPGPNTGGDTSCPPPPAASERQPTALGVDVLSVLGSATLPVDGDWTLPPWPRVYPGAARLYRMGVHHGLDFYSFTGPSGFKVGWPVLAAADGEVIRATIAYPGLTDDEFTDMLEETERLGYTPDEVMQKLAGRHVIIQHADGVRTTYLHLDEIAPGIVTGARVRSGQLIGTVGVTGTQGEIKPGAVGAHLHFEIWIDEHYLGYGMTIREAMWWYETIFDS